MRILRLIFTLLYSLSLPAWATTYNVGPGKTHTNIGDVSWSSLAPGDIVNIYPKTAITAVTASTSTGTTIALTSGGDTIPWGSTVWFSGYVQTTPAAPPAWSSNWTVSLPWVTCGVQGSGLYGKAKGGTACSATSVTISNAANIPAGTTVYFYPPYFEKMNISAAGTASQHIAIQGIPDPVTGVLPALDPHYSTTGPNMNHYGSEQYWDTGGFVVFFRKADQSSLSKYIDFKNLRVQGAVDGVPFYGASGASWTMSGLNIRFMGADHVTIQDCEIVDGGDGIFGATNGDLSYSQIVTNITLRHNHMWQNGAGSGEHQSYMEAQNVLYEYNWYDIPRIGSSCSQLKDRSSGTIIRYNWMTPSIRGLDLIAAQNSADVEVSQVQYTVPSGGLPAGATSLTLSPSAASQVHVGDTVGYVNSVTNLPVYSITAGNPTVLHVASGDEYWTSGAGVGQWMQLRYAKGSCTMLNGVWLITAKDSGTGDVTLALDSTGCSYTAWSAYMYEGYGYPGSGPIAMPTVASVDTGTGVVTLNAPGMPTGIAAGATLHILNQQPNPYKETFVYGNVFEWDSAFYPYSMAPVVHYGWDTAGGIDSVYDRGGTLYFYNNTVIGKSTGSIEVFQTESAYDHVRADNNLFWAANNAYFTLMPVAKYATYAPTNSTTTAGRFDGTGNQIVGTSAVGSNMCVGVTVTGWRPCWASYPTSDLTMDASGIATKTSALTYPLGQNGRFYSLQMGSSAMGAATALPAAVTSNSLGLDLTPSYNPDGTARSNVNDAGANQYSGAPTTYTLTIRTTGTGSGSLSGTNCAAGSYASGTSYYCTATPDSGSTFADWTSTCGGTASGNTYSGTVTANCAVTATFNLPVTTYNLTISSAGTGSGTISGTNCASGDYASGTGVTCLATPGSGSAFAGWSGACSGAGACSFVLSGNTAVTATFNVAASPLTLGLGTCSSTMSATQYVAFSGCNLAAYGGTPPYTYSWKVVTDGSYSAIPEGLSLDRTTGAISGTVYGQGRYGPQFVVTDRLGATATLNSLFFSIVGDNSLGGCSLFPSDSIFHQRVDSLPVDTSPAAPIYSGYQSSALRVFFGNGGNGNLPNGIPFIRVPYNQANGAVTTTAYQSYFSSGPFPSYAPPEATSNNTGDRHVLVVQTAGGGNPCRLWEMWQGIYQGNNNWVDSSNAYWSNVGATGTGAYAMLPQDNGSTDAAGLPIAPLLVTADEVIGTGTPSAPNGSVQHPVRFTVNHMLDRYVWPATAHAGTGSCSGGYGDGNGMLLQGAGAPTSCTMTGPAGEIYRLKASVAAPACAATSPQAAIIIQGLRNYGVILADNGLSGGLIGTPDARWNDSDLACLTSLKLRDFEPVNVSEVAAALTSNYNGSGYSAPVTSYQTTSAAPKLTDITVMPAMSLIVAGIGTQQYAAQCTYSDYTSADCTSTVAWSSSNTAVANISSVGLASAVAPGTSIIMATSGTVTGSETLTVTAPALISISVTPATASIVAGTGPRQYAALCSYSNNTNLNCTATVTWSSSEYAVATITGGGLASAVADGTVTIKATSGGITGSAVLTVTTPTLTGITVTPATASIMAGTGTQQYAAQCAYSNNTNADCTATVTWSSSNLAAATVSGGGLASAAAAGRSTIKAISGSITGSAVLTVTTPTLTGITVTPATASIMSGTGTRQYAAQCAYSNNTNADCTATVTWSSSDLAAATINGVGLASAAAAGRSTIKATSGSIAGSALLTVIPAPVNLTSGLWAWIGGSDTLPSANNGRPGVNSTLGKPAAGATPGSRMAAVGWTDADGNLWLFGGGGFDSAGEVGYLNDLWEFMPSIEEWAWVGGRSTVPRANEGWPGVYGTLGIPSSGNFPGAREASVSWTDTSGNFWLFGGIGYDSAGTDGSLNDLWEFNPSTQEWTWMGGNNRVPSANQGQPGVYGQLGIGNAANIPGSRWGANTWTDTGGNLWLFGGIGYDSTGSPGSLNDLWEFNPSVRQWAWMGGSDTLGNSGGQAGAYGSLGISTATNVPSGRSQAVSWTDRQGNLWLFGGKGYDSTGTLGDLNDLWRFNPSTREWAWMGGSNAIGCAGCGKPGIYGTEHQADSANIPGSRNQAAGWTDSNGNLWLFGGNGYDSAGAYGSLNDVWEFVPSTLEWVWMGGSNTVPATNQGQSGTYGQLGVPDPGNSPGGRWGTNSWNDGNGNLWLFGGAGNDAAGVNGTLNDLWVYETASGNLHAATPTLSVASGTYNATQTVTITDVTPGATIYYTTDGTTPGTGSSVYSSPINVSSTMTIEAIAASKDYKTSAVASSNYTITPAFSISPRDSSATNVTVQPGGVAAFNLVVGPIGSSTLIAPVTLTATGLPPGSTATFTPSTIASGQGATNLSVSIQTSTTTASKVQSLSKWTVALCLLFMPFAGLRRLRQVVTQLPVSARLLAGILFLVGMSVPMSGCSGTVVVDNRGSGGTTPTTYTVTVTASSSDVHHATTVNITVQ